MAQVQLQKLVKTFRNDAGEDVTMVLVGPSGCGKTTTLRMIAGLEEINGGTISIGDRVVNDVAPKDRDITMVFQNYALYPHMTVYENMAFGLRLRKTPKAQIDKRVQEVADQLGLQQLLKRTPGQLSGGQRQRVALGLAIARAAGVFDGRAFVQPRRQTARANARRTDQIAPPPQRNDGLRHARSGRGDDDGPAHRRDARRFDSAVRHADGAVSPSGQHFRRRFHRHAFDELSGSDFAQRGRCLFSGRGSYQVAVPPEQVGKLDAWVGKKVIIGVRPGDVFDAGLTKVISATDENTIETKVDMIEPMGEMTVVYATSGTHQLVAGVSSDTKAREGEMIKLALDLNKTHLSDPETENATY